MSESLLQEKSAVGVIRREDGTVAAGSPNPGGQPKWVREVRESLKSLAPQAVATLREVMGGERQGVTPKDQVKAAEIVLSYTVPKPKQEVEVSGGGASPLALLTPELLVALATGKAPKEGK